MTVKVSFQNLSSGPSSKYFPETIKTDICGHDKNDSTSQEATETVGKNLIQRYDWWN